MKTQTHIRWLMTSAAYLLAGAVQAQTPAMGSTMPTDPSAGKPQLKMERDEFFRTHIWNDTSGQWTLKSGVELPMGVKSREAVKSERDTFLSNNRWVGTRGWTPLKAPRNTSTMSAAERRSQTARFMSTHEWDEVGGMWRDKAVARSPR